MKLDIKTAIDTYKLKKNTSDEIAKEIKALGNTIKSYFSQNDIDTFDTNLFTAKISTVENVSFNEEYAMEILKKKFPDTFKKVVRTKEYIDDDALEKEVYNNQELSNAISLAFTKKEPTVRLLVKEKK